MLLRIEDTDREWLTEPAIAAILDGLRWLGLDWDGEVIYQYSRAARHREVAEALLASGRAYCCYATPEELTAMREKARVANPNGDISDGTTGSITATHLNFLPGSSARRQINFAMRFDF